MQVNICDDGERQLQAEIDPNASLVVVPGPAQPLLIDSHAF
jgi:hypothetical protein